MIDPDAVMARPAPRDQMTSAMHANNEVGTIQPIPEIARIAADAGVALHSYGVQAAGKFQ